MWVILQLEKYRTNTSVSNRDATNNSLLHHWTMKRILNHLAHQPQGSGLGNFLHHSNPANICIKHQLLTWQAIYWCMKLIHNDRFYLWRSLWQWICGILMLIFSALIVLRCSGWPTVTVCVRNEVQWGVLHTGWRVQRGNVLLRMQVLRRHRMCWAFRKGKVVLWSEFIITSLFIRGHLFG